MFSDNVDPQQVGWKAGPGLTDVHTTDDYLSETDAEEDWAPLFSRAVWSKGDIYLSGDVLIDSYDSRKPYGPANQFMAGSIVANGSVTLLDKARVNGQVSYFKDLYSGSGAFVRGGASRLLNPRSSFMFPPIASFPINFVLVAEDVVVTKNRAVTLPPGSYRNIKLADGAELRLRSGTYYIDSITAPSRSRVHVMLDRAYDKPARLFVQSDLHLSNSFIAFNGRPNYNPVNLQVFYSGKKVISIEGSASFYGLVYAPEACLGLHTNDFYGAYVANDVVINGAKIHYGNQLMQDFVMKRLRPFNIIS